MPIKANDPTFLMGLEEYVDVHGPDELLERVAELCHAKADHLVANWQDEKQAHMWDGFAHAVERLVERFGADLRKYKYGLR